MVKNCVIMKVDLLLGLQWGDEGKGKIVDVLTKNYDIIARFQGGPNAGHTLEFDGINMSYTLFSWDISRKVNKPIGNGVVIDPALKEIEKLEPFDIDFQSHYVFQEKLILFYQHIDCWMRHLNYQRKI